MSLSSRGIAPVPEETAAVARAAFPKGNPYMQMRDELGSLYTDDMFADLYPKDGQPAVQPWRLALVTVMQFAENLTDRQAAEAVRDRIAWKYALSLTLTDAGFDYSVLCEFRQRLLDHGAAQRLLDVMLHQFAARGWLRSRGKQRTDSTHILAAIRRLNELAVEAPAWLKQRVNADWFDTYSQRTSNYLLPKKDAERKTWAEQVGQDGFFLLEEIYHRGHHPELAQLPAVEMLRQVWIQHFYIDEGRVCLREKKDQPPAAHLIPSPYDPEARCSTKRAITWIGYKAHLTETCDGDTPSLITNVETRPATEPDHDVTGIIHDHLVEKGYGPAEHYVDQGYMSVDHLVRAQADAAIDLMGCAGRIAHPC
jgi:transposase